MQTSFLPRPVRGRTINVRSWGASLLVAAAVLGSSAALYGQNAARDAANPAALDPVFRVTEEKANLRIVEKFTKIVRLDARIRTVFGFDPQVINVTKVEGDPRSVRVHALAAGVTSLVLVDENSRNFNVEVMVVGDVRHLQAYLKRMFPHSAVEAVQVKSDTVVLRGWVAQPEHITEMVEIATAFYPKVLNHMKVGGVQQVQLKVRVMEVQRSKIRRLGFNFLYATRDAVAAVTPGQLTPLASLSTPFGGPAAASVVASTLTDPSVSFGIVGDNSFFQGYIQALKEEGLLKILAEPKLVTTNGRPANMLAGGEFPLLVPQSLGTVTIEWRQFGVRLEAVPIILGNGRVRLELQPEVSERDFSTAVSINGFTVPGLTSRRVNTQVEMNFGETFVLAGLLSTRRTAETKKIPVLGDMPWVGAAFRRVRYDEGETELVIMVTPELVTPLKDCQVLPGGPGLFTDTPTDRELYLDGMIEVPSYGDHCEGFPLDFPPPSWNTSSGFGSGVVAPGSGFPRQAPAHPPLAPPAPPEGYPPPAPGAAPSAPTTVPPMPEAGGEQTSIRPQAELGNEGRARVWTSRSWTRSSPSRNSGTTRTASFVPPRASEAKTRFAEPGSDGPHRARAVPGQPRPSLFEPKPGLIEPSFDGN